MTPDEKKAVDEFFGSNPSKFSVISAGRTSSLMNGQYVVTMDHPGNITAICAIINDYREYTSQPGPDGIFAKHPRPWRFQAYDRKNGLEGIILDVNDKIVVPEIDRRDVDQIIALANSWQPAQPAQPARDEETVIRESQAKPSELVDEHDPLIGRRVKWIRLGSWYGNLGTITRRRGNESYRVSMDCDPENNNFIYPDPVTFELVDDEPNPAETEFKLYLNTLKRVESRLQALEALHPGLIQNGGDSK